MGTFTGIHPSRGPFHMTRNSDEVSSSDYESLSVGSSVPVCYSDDNPKNCAQLKDVEDALGKVGLGILIPLVCSLLWIGGFTILPAYAFFGWLAISEFAGAFVSAFLTLTACAISITLCCALQGVFKLSARTDFVLQFGEDAEARAEPAQVEQIVCANAVPVAAVASVSSPAIANLESAEMAELVTRGHGGGRNGADGRQHG